jgi:hypothetical protein
MNKKRIAATFAGVLAPGYPMLSAPAADAAPCAPNNPPACMACIHPSGTVPDPAQWQTYIEDVC